MSALKKATSLFRPTQAPATTGPIGIDFALEEMHLVQLQTSPDGTTSVRARTSIPYDTTRQNVLSNTSVFRAHLGRALSQDDFGRRNAVVAVPSGLFRTVSINYRTGPDSDDATAIIEKMRDRVDGDLSDFVLDYLPVKSCTKVRESLALVAVSEREPIVELLESLRKAGLKVEALEIGPVAIARLVGAMSQVTHNQNVLVINSGQQASYLTLLSGADLLFDQQIGFGENGLVAKLADTLELSESMARELIAHVGSPSKPSPGGPLADDEELFVAMSEILKPEFSTLADEIKRVSLYAAAETRGGSVSQVYLLGGIARWPGSDKLLSSLTGMSIAQIPDPLSPIGVANDGAVGTAAPEIAVATGLALRGLHGHG